MPCAIIADAINLLSNAWDGSKVKGTVPSAKNTTYNTAIMSGNQLTKYDTGSFDNGYNGGLQNLPRFHENWGGINCNIAGAFVNLWRSQIATGVYGKSGVYSPPKRFWDFDQQFNSKNPFGFSSQNLGSLYKGLVKDTFQNFKHLRKTHHTHHPVDDARGNAEALLHMKDHLGLKISFD